MIGISADSTKKHRDFIEKKDLFITLLSDEDTSMLQEYGVWQLKKNYGKEYMGIVRTTLIIDPSGVIRAIWEKVKVEDHAQEVMKKLQELQA